MKKSLIIPISNKLLIVKYPQIVPEIKKKEDKLKEVFLFVSETNKLITRAKTDDEKINSKL